MDSYIASEETKADIKYLARCFDVTGRRVQQLVEDGIIEKIEGTRYLNLSDSVRRYIAYIKRDITKLDEDVAQAEKIKKNAEAHLKASKAKIAQFEAKELEGKMHRSEDVETLTEDLIFTIRSALMALPGRLAVDVAAAGSPAEAANIIRKEVNFVMAQLADYDYNPGKYAELVRERRSWDSDAGDEDEQ